MFHDLGYRLVRVGLRGLLRVLGGLRVEGSENLPPSGPVLLAANHVSNSDPPVIGAAAKRSLYFMAKEELFSIPVLGRLLPALHAFPVRPNAPGRGALQRAERLLKAGHPVVIFPEGEESPTGELQEFRAGVALLALRTGAPVVPVYLDGAELLMPYGTLTPRRSPRPVVVRFGRPVPLKDLRLADDRRQALAEATARIREAVAALAAKDRCAV